MFIVLAVVWELDKEVRRIKDDYTTLAVLTLSWLDFICMSQHLMRSQFNLA